MNKSNGKVSIPKETVKTLALQIGQRAAARQLGISEDVVRQWSARDKEGPWIVKETDSHQLVTITPSQATRDSLTHHSKQSKIALARSLSKGATHAESLTGAQVLDKSRNIRDLVGANSQLHGWEERGNTASTVNFNVVADHLSVPIQVNQHAPQSNEDRPSTRPDEPSLA